MQVQPIIMTRDGGTIPNATWNISSNCNITGVTNTDLNRADLIKLWKFNMELSRAKQSKLSILYELADAGSVTGDFTVINTGTGYLRISNTSTPTLSIGGNLNIAGGNFYGSIGTGNPTIDIGGDLNISSGIFNMSSASGIVTLNLNGDFNLTGGTLTETGTGNWYYLL